MWSIIKGGKKAFKWMSNAYPHSTSWLLSILKYRLVTNLYVIKIFNCKNGIQTLRLDIYLNMAYQKTVATNKPTPM